MKRPSAPCFPPRTTPHSSIGAVRHIRRRTAARRRPGDELGNNVVIDYGLRSRDERSALRQAAADPGATMEMRYFELSPAEQRRRLDQRHAEAPHTT
ncbi:AAA family ATPase [Micromonospora sp. KLBMP9576]|uniref:AAA family ATPase n=1 Tax=Micromonospora sp. KLBMP9576 TaxID=3424769 RepID=UPI003D91D7CB